MTPDITVLQQAHCPTVENISNLQLRCFDYVVRMDNSRLPKPLFYDDLTVGGSPRHRLNKRFKNCVKSKLLNLFNLLNK